MTTHLLHPYIYADIPHLTEVCTNLVSNAVKYTGTGGTDVYKRQRLGKMMEDIRHGKDPKEAYEKNIGTYGRFSAEQGAVKYIDPREE